MKIHACAEHLPSLIQMLGVKRRVTANNQLQEDKQLDAQCRQAAVKTPLQHTHEVFIRYLS